MKKTAFSEQSQMIKGNDSQSLFKKSYSNGLVVGIVIFLILIIGLSIISTVHAQQITSKPDSLRVYTKDHLITIESTNEIEILELWDETLAKRRLKCRPKNYKIKVNTQRLKKSDYKIVLVFGKDTKLIKFTK